MKSLILKATPKPNGVTLGRIWTSRTIAKRGLLRSWKYHRLNRRKPQSGPASLLMAKLGNKKPGIHHQISLGEELPPDCEISIQVNQRTINAILCKTMQFFAKLERVLSKDRFDSYRQTGKSDKDALTLHIWNTALCESLYPTFQMLEVGIRNAIHLEIAKTSKIGNWLNLELSGGLYEIELNAVKEAKEALKKRGQPTDEPRLVAEMSFGFWTSLLDSRYETLWHKIIKGVFPNMPSSVRTRSEASRRMNAVRRLRNAAFHHHSIWHWHDLQKQHADIHVLISWICDSAQKTAARIDRFPNVYSSGPEAMAPKVDSMVI
ncbi:MAG: hypothetical protein QM813_21860 [Verrucomicrobiota bacterium]